MKKVSWDKYFFDICEVVKEKSKDNSIQVGCVIVGKNNEIRSTGFNGFPRGVNDNIEDRYERPSKYMFTEHSERNAIYAAARMGTCLNKCKIYVSAIPCADCGRAIIQAGIKTVVIDVRDFENKIKFWLERWKDHIICTMQMFLEADVKLLFWDGELKTHYYTVIIKKLLE